MTETVDLNQDELSCAAWVARFLVARGVDRVFGIQGGHIQPIWDHLGRCGIRIVDVRHECAAVHMAQAHAELTGKPRRGDGHRRPRRDQHRHRHGQRVAGADAGPVDRRLHLAAPGQHGPAPGHPAHRHPAPGLPLLPHRPRRRPGRARARRGRGPRHGRPRRARPRPTSRSRPTCCARTCPRTSCSPTGCAPSRARDPPARPSRASAAAVEASWSARRPLVVTGRGARDCGAELVRLLDASGAVYLDTQESRGLVPPDHPGCRRRHARQPP